MRCGGNALERFLDPRRMWETLHSKGLGWMFMVFGRCVSKWIKEMSRTGCRLSFVFFLIRFSKIKSPAAQIGLAL